MVDIRSRIVEVLHGGYLITLATVDEGGPWSVPVIYVYDEHLNIYWMSDPQSRHSRSIVKNRKIAGTVCVSNTPKEKDFAIQIEGEAESLGVTIDVALSAKFLLKTGKVPVGSALSALKEGYVWYKLKPIRFELIDKDNFGLKRQTLLL